MTGSTADLTTSVEQTLAEQARRNALHLGYVRVVALAVAALLDTAFHFYPRETIGVDHVSAANALLAVFWCLAAVGIVLALRARIDTPAFRAALLFIDPVIVLTLFVAIYYSLRDTPKLMHPVAVNAAAFTLIAVAGALRLTRSAAAWSGAVSAACFAGVGAMAGYSVPEALFVCAVIGCAGLLGMRLAQNTRRAAAAEASRVILQRFVAPDLAAGDPAAALALIGQPRNVEATVVVTDLRGFTARVESLSPEAALAFLNDVQGALAECVRRHGGTVDKFMGDGMLAVFGAAEPLSGHASAAVRAALDLRDIAASRSLGLGVGVHSGPLVAGCVGSGERLEFTIIGDTVNTASRLEAITKEVGADTVVSEATRQQAAAVVDAVWAELGERRIRGREQPLRLFALQRDRR